MEDEELLSQQDLQNQAPLPAPAPSQSPYENYREWAGERLNIYNYSNPAPIPQNNGDSNRDNMSGRGQVNTTGEAIDRANKKNLDTTQYSIETEKVSKRYPLTFKGVDNESIYAAGQTLGEKAFNGVAKMVGTASTTFINGTVGTVYGIASAMDAENGHRIQAFYNNDLSNYLNNINTEMEDTYAHYKTERERNGSWWEPGNLFTANFLFDNIIKNLGFSIGAMGAGFAWGGALKALGLTGRLVGTGEQWAAAADAAVSEATLLPQSQRMGAITSKLTELFNSSKSGIGSALMKADRGIVATFGTFGEAGIEALNNASSFRENMVQRYKAEHGYAPDEEEMAKINKEAEAVGNWSFGLNTALLTATNYIQLPKIFSSSFKSEKSLVNDVILREGAYVSSLPEKGFGKLMYRTKNLLSLGFNTSEAFEEGAQYAIQTGTDHYFDRKYRKDGPSAIEDGLLYGVKETLTTGEGTLNIFLGGVSGALQSSGFVSARGIGKSGKIGERGWTGYGGQQEAIRNEAIDAFNKTKLKDRFKAVYDNIKIAESVQADREAAIRRGDIMESKDLEFDYAHSFVASRLKFGAEDAIKNEIDMLKQQAATETGFNELVEEGVAAKTDTRVSFINRLETLQQHANRASEMNEAAKLKYSGMLDKDGNRVYSDNVIDQMVYAGSKIMNYDDRMSQVAQTLTGPLAKSSISTDTILAEILTGQKTVEEALAGAKTALDENSPINAEELKTNLDDLVEMGLRRKLFISEYNDLKANPEKHHREEVETVMTPEEAQKVTTPRETIKINTKKGEKDIILDEPYMLSRRTLKSDKDYDVYEGPVVNIIGKNEDGTFKVKTSSGKLITMTEDELAADSLSQVSELKKMKKVAFYISNWNVVWKHRGVKINGQPASGRIVYDKDNDRLMFRFLNEKGVVKETEVVNTMFSQKEAEKLGFKQPMITPMTILTAQQEKVTQELAESKMSISEKLKTRNRIINDLYESSKARLDEVIKKLEKAKEKLAKNADRFTDDVINGTAPGKLADLHATITQDINDLTVEKEELEATIPYLKSFIDDVASQPEDGQEMIDGLKQDIKDLDELIDATNDAIKKSKSMLKLIEELLEKVLKVFNNYLKDLKAQNPNVPLFIDELQDRVEKALGPEAAESYIKDRLGFTEKTLELQNTLNLFKGTLNIPKLEQRAQTLKTDLAGLEKGLEELIATQKAKQKLLDSFEEFAERYKATQEEEKRMQTNPELINTLIGTLNKTVQNFWGNKAYDPVSKKPDLAVVTGTRPIDDGKPHQARANHFGARVDTFKNRKNIKGIIVTQKTQAGVIDGLMEHLMEMATPDQKAKYPTSEIIALVMVETDKKGNKYLVDQDGKRIPKDGDALNNAIYQVFPAKDLKGSYKDANGDIHFGSMFREDTPQETIDSLTKQYSDWVDQQLAKTTNTETYDFDASFGFPDFNIIKGDGKETVDRVDHVTRTSVKDSGLVTGNMLKTQPLVTVKTSNAPFTSGNVTFNSPKGRVFLSLKNGAARLFNRKFNEEEAGVIYDVILQLAKNFRDSGGKSTPESEKLFEWLRSTTYWGIHKTKTGVRKDAGYNSIWFEQVPGEKNEKKVKLFISGKTTDPAEGIDFTYSEIYNRKGDMLMLLQQLYNNTSNHLTDENKWNDKYNQIVGIKEDGTPEYVVWDNYQTYLLSDKAYDPATKKFTATRKIEDIPLATKFRPLQDENDTNRKGIYFTLRTSSIKVEKVKKEEKKAEPAPKKEAPKKEAPVQEQPKATNITPEGFVLDGTTNDKNKIKLNAGEVSFTMDIDKYLADGTSLKVTASEEVVKNVMDARSVDETEAQNIIAAAVAARLKPRIDEIRSEQQRRAAQQAQQAPAETVEEPTVEEYVSPEGYKFNGEPHTISLNSGDVTFSLDIDKYMMGEGGIKLDIPGEVVQNVITALNLTGDDANQQAIEKIQAAVGTKLAPSIDAAMEFMEKQKAAPVAEEVSEEAAKEEGAINDKSTIEEVVTDQGMQEAQETNEPPLQDPPVSETTEDPVENTNPEEAIEENKLNTGRGDATIETAAANDVDANVEDSKPKGRIKLEDVEENDDEEFNYREELFKAANDFEGENWNTVEKWLAENLPMLPVYRVKNMIRATNGRYAWGALYNNAIYLTQNAEVGTIYHEAFEAVWKMFVGPKEMKAIIKEFRNRPGYYEDRFTGEKVKYSKATNHQLKEELAEEFRDKQLFGKDPVRTKGRTLIARMFNQLIDFIKSFFTGKEAISNTKQLFDKIGNGYYKTYNPYLTKLSFAQEGIIDIEDIDVGDSAELRINNIPAMQVHDIIQFMTYEALAPLTESNDVLFSLKDILNRGDENMYDRLQRRVLGLIKKQIKTLNEREIEKGILTVGEKTMRDNFLALFDNVQDEWEEIIQKHKEYLNTFALKFEENEDELISNEENSGKGEFDGADKIDVFRKANSAIKLLLGTLPLKSMQGGYPKNVLSSIGGPTLIPAERVQIDLMNKLYDSVNIDEMMERLKDLSLKDPNYFALFKRLTGKEPSANDDMYSEIKNSDYRLISAFWRTMKKQRAEIITVFVLPSGDVVVSDSTLASAAKESKRMMMGKIIDSLKTDKSPYFKYDSYTGKYRATNTLKNYAFSGELSSYTDFLEGLGISMSPERLKAIFGDDERKGKMFRKAVGFIKESMETIGDTYKVTDPDTGKEVTLDTAIMNISSKSLDIDTRMTQLGIIQAMLDNPAYESTYFNIDGERTQSYIGTNTVSSFHDVISKVENFSEDMQEPQNRGFRYLLTDKFAKGSLILKSMFVQEDDGTFTDRKPDTEDIMGTVLTSGTVDESTDRKKSSSRLNYVQRFVQELNLNLEGIYNNLVPGDASLEHGVRMHNEDTPFVNATTYSNGEFFNIFRDYFYDEVGVAREDRLIAKAKGRKATDLRFFKSILADPTSADPNELHDEIMYDEENKELTAEELYDKYESEIEKAIRRFVKEQAKETEFLINKFGLIKVNPVTEKLEAQGLNFSEEELEGAFLKEKLEVMSVNYMIANIELHKLVYSDPYMYTDELKRIKNYNSPRQALLHGSQDLNAFLQEEYNKEVTEDTQFALTDFERDHMRAITIGDVWSINPNKGYDEAFEETDGGGYFTLQGHRKFKLKLGDWTPANEAQFQFDMEFERRLKAGESESQLREYLKGSPDVKSTYTPAKPIVSGNKENGREYNDTVLHKFALVPISARILWELRPDGNSMGMKLLNKMVKEDIDYAVFATGSKVGTEQVHDIYGPDGKFVETPFETQEEKDGLLTNADKRGVSKIPFSIIGLQTEVPSKDTPLVTQGTQITKLVTMDFMEAGVPLDYKLTDSEGHEVTDIIERFKAWNQLDEKGKEQSELYRLMKKNRRLLEEKILDGYNTLIKKLGIVETADGFLVTDRDKFIATLKSEIMKREVNDNITDAFDGFKDGHVVLEATPVYQQIRYILYSIADKNVVRPKISGGMKVQIPSAMLLDENKVVKETITDEKTGETKTIFQSDELDFYVDEDGKRVCEIMVGRWFKSNKTDEELMDYFNNTEEGRKELAALTGVAFRIPTQKQNSIDAFRIKKFLPKSFGDSVVVPSALVKKAGSDFDIDKLSIYLKNVFTDYKGDIKTVPFYGYGEEAKEKFSKLFDKMLGEEKAFLSRKILNREYMHKLFFDIAMGTASDKRNEKWVPIFNEMFQDMADEDGAISVQDVEQDFMDVLASMDKQIDKLNDEDFQALMKDVFIDRMYKKSLENEYITSLEDLVSHPLNYDALVKPNSAKQLKDLAKKINAKKGIPETDYTNVGNMLSRGFMSTQRHNFVTGKQGVAIAARAQTNHAQNQLGPIFLDFRKMYAPDYDPVSFALLGGNEKSTIYATNPRINFANYNKVEIDGMKFPTLSMSKAAGTTDEYISDTIGMSIDGYVDIAKGAWIMELGATPTTAGTWLFLSKIGVPITDIAYFMNQPIIVDYLQLLENKGQSWLFSSRNLSDMLDTYRLTGEAAEQGITEEIPDADSLLKTIGVPLAEMNNRQKDAQQFMLKEFVKYAKQANQLFEVSQATNYDTANINDPNLVMKKQVQVESSRDTIISGLDENGKIIPATDALMKNTFLDVLKNRIEKFRDAFAEAALLSDRPIIRDVMESVLRPYTKMDDKSFVKLSQKAVNDLFDWAVQNDRKINTFVISTLRGNDKEKAVAKQIMDYKDSILGNTAKGIKAHPEHPLYHNIILNSIQIEEGFNRKKVNNVYLSNISKVYDQNMVIHGFNELREHLKSMNEGNDLYKKICRLAVLQSGLSNSRIAFTTLLPYKDFKELYNPTLTKIEAMPNLKDFKNLDVFERNNWSNKDIIPTVRGEMKVRKSDFYGTSTWDKNAFFIGEGLKKGVNKFQLPHIVNINTSSAEASSDFIVYTWEKYLPYPKRILAKKTGDRTHIQKYLMKKVYTTDPLTGKRVPLINISQDEKTGTIYHKFVYKAINAWGDSFKANELYDHIRASKLDNDFNKVELLFDKDHNRIGAPEVEDEIIADIMEGRMSIDTLIAVNLKEDQKGYIAPAIPVTPVEATIEVKKTEVSSAVTDLGYTAEQWGALSPIEQKEALKKAKEAVTDLSYNPAYGLTEEEWNSTSDTEKKTIIDQLNNC